MADLKTTQERRDRFRTWLHDDTRDHLSIRAWCVAEDACDDVDALLVENAKLRTVAEAEVEVERLREILAPGGLVELEPTVEDAPPIYRASNEALAKMVRRWHIAAFYG